MRWREWRVRYGTAYIIWQKAGNDISGFFERDTVRGSCPFEKLAQESITIFTKDCCIESIIKNIK